MDNYLIDRQTLLQFVDELIKKKPLPVESAEELNSFREEKIKELDDQITMAVFGGLTEDQDREINELLDRGEENPEVFKSFFERAGIDLEKTITKAMEDFAKEYLEGGENV